MVCEGYDSGGSVYYVEYVSGFSKERLRTQEGSRWGEHSEVEENCVGSMNDFNTNREGTRSSTCNYKNLLIIICSSRFNFFIVVMK